MKTISAAMLLLLALIVLGCSDTSSPLVPVSHQALSTATSTTALAKGAWVQMATGSGHLHPRGEGLTTFSFTAQKDADGLCKGEWQGYDRDINVKFHLKVRHLDVEGHQAFMVAYGMLPETPWYGPPTPGYAMVLITDNGQGNKAALPDQHCWIALWPDTEEMPWAFVTSNLATASASQAKIFLANVWGWKDAMLYVPCEMGNLQVESR